ncbi:MAG: hypothetical protein GX763_09665 [Clostridiaceae bacterium]|nr:hypothetical protein [Clostridiaceae bacterium]
MINVTELSEAIKGSGKKRSYLAEKLGIGQASFYNKAYGLTEFTAREMLILSEELNLNDQESRQIFLTK